MPLSSEVVTLHRIYWLLINRNCQLCSFPSPPCYYPPHTIFFWSPLGYPLHWFLGARLSYALISKSPPTNYLVAILPTFSTIAFKGFASSPSFRASLLGWFQFYSWTQPTWAIDSFHLYSGDKPLFHPLLLLWNPCHKSSTHNTILPTGAPGLFGPIAGSSNCATIG